MIRVTDFNQLISDMVDDIKVENPDLSGFILVANEKHLVRRLSDNRGVWIVATIPSADPQSDNEDIVAENNVVWLFIIEKADPGNMNPMDEIEHYQKTQDVVTSIKNWLLDQKTAGNEFLEFLNLRSMFTDPEYQIGGWNGWSVSFNFDTGGY